MVNAAASAGAAGPFTGLRAGREQQTPSPSRRRRRTFQGLRAGREQRMPTPTPPRQQYLQRDYFWPDGDADGLCWSTQRHADDSTTRPFGSGPTRQSDARDSKLSHCMPTNRQGTGRRRVLP
jgi:hypothetical protein